MDVTWGIFWITSFHVERFTNTGSVITGSHTFTFTIRVTGTRFNITVVILGTRVFTRLIGIKSFNFEIRETHRFIKRSLIDRIIKSDGSTSGSMSNNGINLVVHVIIPTNSTNLLTISPRVGLLLNNGSV